MRKCELRNRNGDEILVHNGSTQNLCKCERKERNSFFLICIRIWSAMCVAECIQVNIKFQSIPNAADRVWLRLVAAIYLFTYLFFCCFSREKGKNALKKYRFRNSHLCV